MLSESLNKLDAERANLITLTNAWKTGDAAVVGQLVVNDVRGDPVMYQRLLVDRNHACLPRLDALLTRCDRAFVVVCAAQLIGPDGLLTMFSAKSTRSPSSELLRWDSLWRAPPFSLPGRGWLASPPPTIFQGLALR